MDVHCSQSGFDPELIRRYDGRGPRYTSYPTALQFTPNIGPAEYAANARQSNSGGLPLSLYVHVPFCHQLCYYCGCNKIVTRNEARVARYLDALHKEIAMQGELFDRSRMVEQLHFGGGTPTYLDAEQLDRLFAVLRRNFSFDESDERQYSIEVDPRTVDYERLVELESLGFNRLSLGVQDFDAKVQEAVNRTQSLDSIVTLVDDARGLGFGSISFDLIYGLPHQSLERFDRTLTATLDIRPERLSVYNYAHLPARFKGQRMIREEDLPSAETKLAILGRTVERLTDAGYVYIGMDHFALPEDELAVAQREGGLQRNFQGYSTHWHCDLVGLGVSSIGSIGNVYAQNTVSTQDYEELIERGELALAKGLRVDRDDRIRAAVIQSLMCYDRLSFAEFGDRFDIDFKDYFAGALDTLKPMAADALLAICDDEIRILPKGRYVLRNIAMSFDRYLGSEPVERFSKAI
ncbi:MAG: oxygen-independent coproporphyrinogen III oxidase [Pseudomonadota bacterium]